MLSCDKFIQCWLVYQSWIRFSRLIFALPSSLSQCFTVLKILIVKFFAVSLTGVLRLDGKYAFAADVNSFRFESEVSSSIWGTVFVKLSLPMLQWHAAEYLFTGVQNSRFFEMLLQCLPFGVKSAQITFL